eukprot:NODE_470_length_8086_cov_0.567422.p4 type:complete len:262 gc:universal NODE_470_length_8086_cov_0.567422:1706-2491(+)
MLGFIPIGSVLTFWFGFLIFTLFTFKIGSFTYWHPYPKAAFHIQLTGAVKTDLPAKVYILDGLTTPKDVIDTLHAAKKTVICQISIGTVKKGTVDYQVLTEKMIGLESPSGSYYADIRSTTVMMVMENRLDEMAAKNCDAVDATDVESWKLDTGYPIGKEDQLRYNIWMSNKAHEKGLSIGLHGDEDQIVDLVDFFDFAVNYECYTKNECEKYFPFIDSSKAAFIVEYKASKDDVCPYANEMELSVDLKTSSMGPEYQACQ